LSLSPNKKMKTEPKLPNSGQLENEGLKEKIRKLEARLLEQEKELGEKKVVWQLCSGHESNGKAVGCSEPREGTVCPLYTASAQSIQDVFVRIPKVFDTFLNGLSLREIFSRVRGLNKTFKSLIDDNFKNFLPLAIGTGNVEWVKRFIEEGDLYTVNNTFSIHLDDGKILRRMSPLAIAAHASSLPQHVEIGKLLIEAGADLDTENGEDMTPLFVAAERGGELSGEFLKMMIEAGAEVDEYDMGGPLFGAIKRLETHADHEWASENIKILVAAGANVRGQEVEFLDGENRRSTALHCLLKSMIGRAIKVGLNRLEVDLELVDLFLAAGAKKKKVNSGIQTPLEYASWEFAKNCQNKRRRDKAILRLARHLNVRYVRVQDDDDEDDGDEGDDDDDYEYESDEYDD